MSYLSTRHFTSVCPSQISVRLGLPPLWCKLCVKTAGRCPNCRALCGFVVYQSCGKLRALPNSRASLPVINDYGIVCNVIEFAGFPDCGLIVLVLTYDWARCRRLAPRPIVSRIRESRVRAHCRISRLSQARHEGENCRVLIENRKTYDICAGLDMPRK